MNFSAVFKGHATLIPAAVGSAGIALSTLSGCGLFHHDDMVARRESVTVQVKATPIDPALAHLSNEELIDRLQNEADQTIPEPHGYGIETPAFARPFLPVKTNVASSSFGIFGHYRDRQFISPIMVELVRRGPSALPTLLAHVSDLRLTQITFPPHWTPGVISTRSLPISDQYEYRYYEKGRQPTGVNTIDPRNAAVQYSGDRPYTYKVGDLCYGAVGQIVNRENVAESAPTEVPSLARAVRSDWAGLTEEQHQQSLLDDVENPNAFGHDDRRAYFRALGALQRLLFYYPQSGQKAAQSLLNRYLEPTAWGQADLIVALEPFQWEGLNDEIWRLYQKAAADCLSTENSVDTRPDFATAFRRNLSFDLALQCARRLVHQGHDGDFEAFFAGQLKYFDRTPLDDTKALLQSLRAQETNPHAGRPAAEGGLLPYRQSGPLLTSMGFTNHSRSIAN